MGTFDKALVEGKGLAKFAEEVQREGAYKIYESDSNYHVVYDAAYVQSLLHSPYVKNPRVVWKKGP